MGFIIITIFMCFVDRLYNVTYISFWLALLHFVSECFYYKSAPLTVGVIAPLTVSSMYWNH